MTLFTTTYLPTKSTDIIGQEKALAELKDFILNYKKKERRAALLHGPVGTGKTSAVYALANELGYDLLELNSSDLRNEEQMKSFLGAALGQQSLFFRPKIILVDEVDALSGTYDRGGSSALVSALEKSTFPVILTANDPYDQKFKALRNTCQMIAFEKVDYRSLGSLLKRVCEQEKIPFEEKALNSLARQADGDVRSALIDLQLCAVGGSCTFERVQSLSDRQRLDSILQALAVIFKSSTVQNALPALENVDMDYDEIFLWLDENLPKEYLSPRSLAKAYEWFSRADVFKGRIHRQQHWRLLVYIQNLLTAGISSAKEEKNSQFIKYMPTMRLLRMWQIKMKLGKKKDIAAKLGRVTHTSQKKAVALVPHLQNIFQHTTGEALTRELDLTEEEVGWLRKK